MAGSSSAEFSNIQSNNNHVQLLVIDENQFVNYCDSCKIQINKISKKLLIETINKNFKFISIPFQNQFIQQNNILCAFTNDKKENNSLIFKNKEICGKVFHAITGTSSASEKVNTLNEIFINEFFDPLCITFLKNENNLCLKTLLLSLMEVWVDDKSKEDLIKLLKEKHIYSILFPQSQDKLSGYRLRKRKHKSNDNKNEKENYHSHSSSESESEYESDIEFDDDNFSNNVNNFNDTDKHPTNKNRNEIIKPSNYEFIKQRYREDGKIYKKLIIFVNEEKNLCHEFLMMDDFINAWYCKACRNNFNINVHAKIYNIGKNNEYAELSEAQHRCNPMKFPLPESLWTKVKIINLPNFKLQENTKFDGTKNQLLILFDSNDRNLCYVYTWIEKRKRSGKKVYICNSCHTKGHRNVRVKVGYHKKNGLPYVEVPEKMEHACKLKEFKLLNFTHKIVEKPNFQIETIQDKNGVEKKKLIIFDFNNKKLCYVYYYNRTADNFQCDKCKAEKSVTAKLLHNYENGKEYIKLGDMEHVCKLEKYNPLKFSPIIVTVPNFQFKDFIQNGKKKTGLLIYDFSGKNKKLFYSYVYRPNLKLFICIGCERKQDQIKAYVFKNEDGSDYIELGHKKHVCKPQDKPIWNVVTNIKR